MPSRRRKPQQDQCGVVSIYRVRLTPWWSQSFAVPSPAGPSGLGVPALLPLRAACRSNRPRRDRIQDIMSTSLMLVTALNPKIGYDNASKVQSSAQLV